MSQLAQWAPGNTAVLVTIQVLVQIIVVVLIAMGLDRLLSRRSASARHAVWLCALLITLAGPAIVLALARTGLTLATISWTSSEPSDVAPARTDSGTSMADSSPIAFDSTDQTAPTQPPLASRATVRGLDDVSIDSGIAWVKLPDDPGSSRELDSARPEPHSVVSMRDTVSMRRAAAGGIVVAWLIGMAMLLVRLVRGMVVLAALRRSARPIDAESIRSVVDEVRAGLGMARLPAILESPRVTGPVATGVLRPAVIMPQGLVGTIPHAALRDILIHECSHITRRDPLIGLLQRLAELIYWPHPLVHVLNRRLSRAHEEVCDDIVLSRGDPIDYARTLLTLAERFEAARRTHGAPALLSPSWKLEDRVAGILNPGRKLMSRINRGSLFAMALVLVIASLAVASVRWEESRPPGEGPTATAETEQGGQAPAEPVATRHSITGIVVDETGKPVAGASVRLIRDWKAPGGAVTGADGRFVLQTDGTMILLEEDVIATNEEGRHQGIGTFHESLDSQVPSAPARIVLKPSKTVTANVTDQAGKPIAEATVEVIADHASVATGKTDPAGRAILRVPDGPKVEWIVALKPGAGFDYFENYRSWPSEGSSTTPETVSLVLNGAVSASIRAVDTEGRPIPGVVFRPWMLKKPSKLAEANLSGGRIAQAITDEQGIATFDWLSHDLERGVPLTTVAAGYHAPERPMVSSAQNPAVSTVRLVRKVVLRGTVLRPDGKPAPGILVEAAGVGKTRSNEYHRAYARTDGEGTYSLDVAPDHSYIIAVLNQSWATRGLTGIVPRREGETLGLPVLHLIKGTLLQGRVTLGPDRKPLEGGWVSLDLQGELLPRDFKPFKMDEREHLYLSTKSDAQGRYSFRVGPGEYELRSPDQGGTVRLTVASEEVIVRDFHLKSLEGVRSQTLSGVVRDRTRRGEPLLDAMVTAIGNRGRGVQALADAQGRFEVSLLYDPSFLYARNRDGSRAGFTAVKFDQHEATVDLLEASRASGRVVNSDGKSMGGHRVQLRMDSGTDYRSSAHIFNQVLTDDQGRYTFPGLVVGTHCEVMTPHRYPESPDDGGIVEVQQFEVRGPDPIARPDLVIPVKATRRVAVVEDTRRPAVPAPSRPPTTPSSPSRAEIEALIRAFGRDPVTPERVDRIAAWFHPRVLWSHDFDRTRRLATDTEFTGRMDRLAREVLGKPLDTILLLRAVMSFHVGRDEADMKSFLRQWTAEDQAPRVTIRGTIVDESTRLPIPNARVFASDSSSQTDNRGRFTSSVSTSSKRSTGRVALWVEADGYASGQIQAPLDGAVKAEDRTISLKRDVSFHGTVLDPTGRPVRGAVVVAHVHRDLVVLGGLEPGQFTGGSHGIYQVQTDAEGRFSFQGIPPTDSSRPIFLKVSHPNYLDENLRLQAPTDAQAPPVVSLKPGCTVEGVVVDDLGRPLSKAWVQVRDPSNPGYHRSDHTDGEGQFRFRNVAPGRWRIVVQAEGLAAVWAQVVASQERPVQDQIVLEPGGYISGKVVDRDGKPVADAAVGWVNPISSHGSPERALELQNMTNTDDAGTFRVGPLPPGEHQLTAWTQSPPLIGTAQAKINRADLVITVTEDERSRR